MRIHFMFIWIHSHLNVKVATLESQLSEANAALAPFKSAAHIKEELETWKILLWGVAVVYLQF